LGDSGDSDDDDGDEEDDDDDDDDDDDADDDDDDDNVGASRGPLEARLEPSAGSPSASRGFQKVSNRLSQMPRTQHKFNTAPSQQESGLCQSC